MPTLTVTDDNGRKRCESIPFTSHDLQRVLTAVRHERQTLFGSSDFPESREYDDLIDRLGSLYGALVVAE